MTTTPPSLLICTLVSLCLMVFVSPSRGLAQQDKQHYSVFRIPDSLLQNADQVVRYEEMVFRVKNTQYGTLYHKKAVTLLNANNTEALLPLFYDQDTKIRFLTAHIYDVTGKYVRKIESKEIRDQAAVDGFSIYTDSRVRILEVAQGTYPFTLEYEYEMQMGGIGFAVFPDWYVQDYRTSVQSGRFEIDLPASLRFYYRSLNIDIVPEEKTLDAGRKSWIWKVDHLKAIPQEPFMPAPSSMLPMILTAPDAFEIDGFAGSMATWSDFGAFIHRMAEGRDVLPDAVKADVHSVIAQADDDDAKVAALYRYLQGKMRYVSVQVGIGGWQPFDAKYVAENQYGDCKALSNYMKALLKEAGIEAWMVLIKNGRLDYDVDTSFTTPRFNHAILYVPESDMWLECTSSDMPPNYIGAGNADRNVLLITPQGGRLKRTPAQNADFNRTTNRTRLTLKTDGSAQLTHQSHNRGEPHDILRSLVAYQSQEEREQWLLKNTALPTFTLEAMHILPDTDTPEATLTYQAKMDKFGTRTGKRWFIPANPVNFHNNIPPVQTERSAPVAMNAERSEIDTITVALPEGFLLENYPTQVLECEQPFGRYSLRIEPTDAGFVVYRSLRLHAATLPKEAYEDCRNFFRDIAKYDATKVVIKQTE